MKKATLLFILSTLLVSCYTGYYSKFHSEENKRNKFDLISDSTINFHFQLHGFDWRSRYSKQDYQMRKRNSSLKFNFNIENNNLVFIKKLNFDLVGILESDTIILNPKYVNIDLSGVVKKTDYIKNSKLKLNNHRYSLLDTFPLDSIFANYYFPANRENFQYTLFNITIFDPKASDCDKFILKLSIDCEINNIEHEINRQMTILKTIEKRLELGIH